MSTHSTAAYQREWRRKNLAHSRAYHRAYSKRPEVKAKWQRYVREIKSPLENVRRWMNPEPYLVIERRATRHSREALTDRYIRWLICKALKIKAAQVPQAAIEWKRAQMKRQRAAWKRTGRKADSRSAWAKHRIAKLRALVFA